MLLHITSMVAEPSLDDLVEILIKHDARMEAETCKAEETAAAMAKLNLKPVEALNVGDDKKKEKPRRP